MPNNTLTFHISKMHCASCAVNIQRSLRKLPGVIDATVNYANEQATIQTSDPRVANLVKETVASLGYEAQNDTEINEDLVTPEKQRELQSLRNQVLFSGVVAILLLGGAMIPATLDVLKNPWVMLFLASIVQFGVGRRFYKSAFSALKNKTTNMDTLIALGTSVAYGYSLVITLFSNYFVSHNLPTHVYFDSSATIITLILLGKYLEMNAKKRTSDALKKLINLQVKFAHVWRNDHWVNLPIQEVIVQDRLLIKPGERIPTDGVIIKGNTAIDESMISGESIPVDKKITDSVVGATINQSSAIEVEVTQVGSNTILAQIVRLVREAQGSRPEIQNLVDTISSYFVPAVIILALITFLIWFFFGPEPRLVSALISTTSVLIIACPCALGLATPTSLVVAVGKASQNGILVRNAQALEIANRVNTVIFDKTGTLTIGKPQLKELIFSSGVATDTQQILKKAIVEIETQSSHPLAQAIVLNLNIPLSEKPITENIQEIPGKGMLANLNGKKIAIGNSDLMVHEGFILQEVMVNAKLKMQQNAYTPILVGYDEKVIAIFGIADTLRENAQEVVEQLKERRITPVLLTGDTKESAEVIGHQLGITEIRAHVLPQDKEAVIQSYQEQEKVVAMVGDGINDAPALAKANLSVAMGSGTDIAISTSSVTLLNGNLNLVPKIIKLSKATMQNIRENLTWAFGYNIVLIPVAMGVLYPLWHIQLNPILAGGAMAFSSVSVVLNALRLRNLKL